MQDAISTISYFGGSRSLFDIHTDFSFGISYIFANGIFLILNFSRLEKRLRYTKYSELQVGQYILDWKD